MKTELVGQNKLYKPREIAKLGLIRNSVSSDNETANYQFIVKLIKEGKLKAKDYGTKGRKYWLVSKAEIERYQQEIDN